MDRRTRWIAGGAIALAVVGGGTGIAIASSNDDDRPLTGSALDQATAAALDYTGGGTVVETDTRRSGALPAHVKTSMSMMPRTTVPLPGSLSISSRPPIASRRSAMP